MICCAIIDEMPEGHALIAYILHATCDGCNDIYSFGLACEQCNCIFLCVKCAVASLRETNNDNISCGVIWRMIFD